MKLMDKLKNALFEEEYVEVEEKPKKEKVKKEKPKKEDKPIAKKIVQPKIDKDEPDFGDTEELKLDVEVGKKEHLGEALAYNPTEVKEEFKFPMVDDNEFDGVQEEEKDLENPEFLFDEDTYSRSETYRREEAISNYHREEKKEQEHKPYGMDDFTIETPEYGLYEKKEDRTYFKPSPIISPIYGIMDKNYKKDDIKPRKEIKVTSYEREKINVDDVRRKAFGEELKEEKYEGPAVEEESMLDLTKEDDTPEVNKVTVGDAEEYFEDLGLEYNVDYKDASANNEGRTKQIKERKRIEKEKIEKPKKEDDSDDDNLFDLIDSMYDGE